MHVRVMHDHRHAHAAAHGAAQQPPAPARATQAALLAWDKRAGLAGPLPKAPRPQGGGGGQAGGGGRRGVGGRGHGALTNERVTGATTGEMRFSVRWSKARSWRMVHSPDTGLRAAQRMARRRVVRVRGM